MKIVAVTICHYGAVYLTQCIEALKDHVDEHLIFYTSHPSHGTKSNLTCPDTKSDIIRAIQSANSPMARLVESSGFQYEGQHRDFAYRYAKVVGGADYIVVADYDEIWPSHTIKNVLEHVKSKPEVSTWLLNFTTLFRSFNWVCYDEMWPTRIINTRAKAEKLAYLPLKLGEVYHLGYAIPDSYMNYKWSCHGHIAEMKHDWMKQTWHEFPNYVKDYYELGTPMIENVHPTCDVWHPQEFNKTLLPEPLHRHPYFSLEKGECIV